MSRHWIVLTHVPSIGINARHVIGVDSGAGMRSAVSEPHGKPLSSAGVSHRNTFPWVTPHTIVSARELHH
jgi:hypothetical protein